MICVSVLMIAYNHEEYIEKAIRSVLLQKVDFKIELVIGDDSSKDSTRRICEDLQNKFPDIIRYEYNKRNIGMNENFLKTYDRCTGKYIAMLEGDDEWIDELKLQKEVDILEKDETLVAVFSNAVAYNIKEGTYTDYYKAGIKPQRLTQHHQVVRGLAICTGTFLFRKVISSFPLWFVKTKASAYFLYYLLSKYGDFYYLDCKLSKYNQHFQGMGTKTNVVHMLYDDSLKLYHLGEHFNKDSAMMKILIEKNLIAINNLYNRPEYTAAVKLFWHLPFIKLMRYPDLYSLTLKTFGKTHLRLKPSKRVKKTIY